MSELLFDRLVELKFNEIDYLLQLTVDDTGLKLELEEKQSNSIWTGHYTPEKLQELTQKAGSFKDFTKFSQMLIDAVLQPTNAEVKVDLLTCNDLEELRKARGGSAKPVQQMHDNRRILILNYKTSYDKVHYPLTLNFEEVPQERLKLRLVIRRLRTELEIYRRGGTPNVLTEDWMKQSMSYRQENEMLKARIRKLEEASQQNNSGLQQSQVRQMVRDEKLVLENSHLKELVIQTEDELKLYKSRFEEKEREVAELTKELKMILKDMDRTEELHKVYQKLLQKQKEEVSKKVYQQLNGKLSTLTKQTSDLVSELNFSREQEKKSKLRIGQLERELESVLKRTANTNANTSSGYIKRPGTPTSQRKSGHKEMPDKTKRSSVRKRSVVDSDTESSRMRKATNSKVSPFRNSKVGVSPGRSQAVNRSRSKQNITTHTKKSAEKKSATMSPRSNAMTQSQQNVDPNYPSESDSEGGNISQTLAMLRRQREEALRPKEKKPQGDLKLQSQMEKKIGHIAEMLRKSRKE